MGKTEEVMVQYQVAVGTLPADTSDLVRHFVSEHLWTCSWFVAALAPRGCRVTKMSVMGEARMAVDRVRQDSRGLKLPYPELLASFVYGAALDILAGAVTPLLGVP